jgi:uncharacterized protein (DUF2384 family)
MKKAAGTKTFTFEEWRREVDLLTQQKDIEIARLHSALVEILHVTSVDSWMETPNPSLDGFTPEDLVQRGEIDRIWRIIHRREAGVRG